ncbi:MULTISPECIES: S1C family serine protease [unclassified Azospirillum]|uniref:S1C family serine protease n=1 Tax=unclassified Azospirillum TaxID=2630922 RepID=UPI000D646C42|nr:MULTISPECIES: S1C family serine protease [unclassified Azospirillum]
MRVVSAPVVPRLAAAILVLVGIQLGALGAGPAQAADPEQLDPDRVVRSVVGISAVVPPDSQSARTLGTEREGSGVVIDGSGLILTIGYTVMEASQIEVTAADGRSYPASMVAYDPVSGFGLLRAEMGFSAPWLRLANADAVKEGDTLLALSGGDNRSATAVKLVSKREFAGYWEYLLDEALFTFPPIRAFNGAALVDREGRLVGIGSLLVMQAVEGRGLPGNMFVPVSALEPILADLLAYGRRQEPARPWLGVTLREELGRLMVEKVSPRSPAESAGLRPGDWIVGVGGQRFSGLADFYRKLWGLGPAGVVVPLEVMRGATLTPVPVTSADRVRFLRLNPTL